MKKRVLSALMVLCMVLTLLPVSAFAADTKDLRDTEFHIMGFSDLKELVAEQNKVNAEDVTIHGIYVNGTQPNGEPGTATGGVSEDTIKKATMGDVGIMGLNGKLVADSSVWKILNTSVIIDPASVNSITVYAKTGVNGLGWGGTNLDPVTIYLDEDDIILPIKGKLITEIYLKNASLEPPVETEYSYTVNYFWVDEQENVTPSTTVDSVTKDTISQQSIFDSVKKASDLEGYTAGTNYVLDTEKSSKDFTWTRDNQVFEVFYAVDANKDGTPDYREKTYTLFYNPNGAAGTITDSNQYYAGNSAALESGATLGTENDGIVFLGWTQGENGHTASNPAKQKPTDVTLLQGYVTFVDANITVYAVWAEDTNDNNKPDYEETPAELGWPIQVSFCDPSGATIGTMQVIKKDEQATPPTSNGDKEITGWTLDSDGQNKYDGLFTYSALAKLVDEAKKWNEYYKEGYLTFYAVYAEEPETVTVTVEFVDEATGKVVPGGTKNVTVPADNPAVALSALTPPAGYVLSENNADPTIAKGDKVTIFVQQNRTFHVNYRIDLAEGYFDGLADVDYYPVTMTEQNYTNYTILNPIPKSGYQFVQWQYDGDTTGTLPATATLSDVFAHVFWYEGEGNITLTAVFERITDDITVEFVDEATGEVVPGGTKSVTVPDDGEVDPTTLKLPDGYILVDNNPITVKPGLEKIQIVVKQNRTITITLKFDNGEGTWSDGFDDSQTRDVTYTSGDEVIGAIPEVTAPSEDLKFSHWTATVNGTTLNLDPEELNGLTYAEAMQLFGISEGDVELTAVYEPVSVSITVQFVDVVTGEQVGGPYTMDVSVGTTQINTYRIPDEWIPDGYEVAQAGDVNIEDGVATVKVRRIAPTNDALKVLLGNLQVDCSTEGHEPITTGLLDGSYTVTGDGLGIQGDVYVIQLSTEPYVQKYIAAGYSQEHTSVSGDTMLLYLTHDGTKWIAPANPTVMLNCESTTPTEKQVILNYYDEVNDVQVKEETITVPADAIHVSINDIPAIEGYEFTVTGDLPIMDGYVYVGLKPVEKPDDTVIMTIRFVLADGTFVGGGDYFLPEGVQNLSILEQYVPVGYEMAETGDFMVTDGGSRDVRVEKLDDTVIMNIRFVLADGTFIAGGDYFLPEGIQNMSILEQYVPEGYKMMESGDFFVTDGGQEDITVEKIAEPDTQSVTVTYWDTTNDKQVGESFTVAVAADATNLNTSVLTNVPEGYELVWTGDLAIENGAVRVEVRPVTTPPVEKTFTVTFDSNGGSAVASQTVKEGEKAVKPANPTRSNYTFEGWFTDETLKNAYDFNTPVTGDITLYADWDRRSSGGGGGGGSTSTKKYTITVICGEGGEITPDGGSDNEVEVRKGNDQTFRISADNGYRISDVLVDGESVGSVDKYTFKDVDEDHEIEAIFARRAADPSDSGTDRYLNTEDHVQYMTGYPNGSFGPSQNMTRAEAAQMFYALLLDKNVAHTVSFSDVPADAWYAEAVNTLASLGMINGYPDGTFRPDAPITRAEFCVIALAFAYEPEDFDCDFRDVSTRDWFYDYVAQATSYGWISGSDRSFRPNECITRAEVSVIVNNMLGRVADEDYIDRHEDELNTFPDVKPSHWAYYSIMETANSHDYTKNNGNENWR